MSAPRAAAAAAIFACGPDEDGLDDPERGGFEGRPERGLVAGMGDRHLQLRQRLGGRDQAVVLLVLRVSTGARADGRSRHSGLLRHSEERFRGAATSSDGRSASARTGAALSARRRLSQASPAALNAGATTTNLYAFGISRLDRTGRISCRLNRQCMVYAFNESHPPPSAETLDIQGSIL